jgi:hypothetical protein
MKQDHTNITLHLNEFNTIVAAIEAFNKIINHVPHANKQFAVNELKNILQKLNTVTNGGTITIITY